MVEMLQDMGASLVCLLLAMALLPFAKGYILIQIGVAALGSMLIAYVLLSLAALAGVLNCRGEEEIELDLEHSFFIGEEEHRITGVLPARHGTERPFLEMLDCSIQLSIAAGSRRIIGDERCAICLGELQEEGDPAHRMVGERMFLKCSHSFHSPCIQKWLSLSTSCPICRARV
ncbi:putative RING-H2 finger protein ATL37 [Selaginella moellendorffii]|nr:putative RING-H2 finger protein ATL37 [Selaginella moellendorffii]|eukprot:XP_002974865.2 putative RING-H2 finger protein ATL37 [Selaginella moellendorffii]